MGKINFKTQDQLAAEQAADWRASAKVSALQARIALARTGLLTQVKTLVEANPDSEIAVAWEYATEFRYDSPFLNAVSEELQLTTEDKDALFRLAETIKV